MSATRTKPFDRTHCKTLHQWKSSAVISVGPTMSLPILLRVPEHIKYKTAMNGWAPQYLSHSLVRVTDIQFRPPALIFMYAAA